MLGANMRSFLEIMVLATMIDFSVSTTVEPDYLGFEPVCKDLRILPLGDSITRGERSTDGNGYRLPLYQKLKRQYNVEFVGTQKSGSMEDNRHEGHSGFPIERIGNEVLQDYADKPNVVLLMAGTNDIMLDIDVSNAPKALSKLIRNITESLPEAVVLVATLPPLLDHEKAKQVDEFNAKIPAIMKEFEGRGRRVAKSSMDQVTREDIHEDDGIHPKDSGYETIAHDWYGTILQVDALHWVKPPKPRDNPTQEVQTNANDEDQPTMHDLEAAVINKPAQIEAATSKEGFLQMDQSRPEIEPKPEQIQSVQLPYSAHFDEYAADHVLYMVVGAAIMVIAAHVLRRCVSARSRRYSPLPKY